MNSKRRLLISIVTYNSAHIIEQCLTQLLRLDQMQDFLIEVVISDNASIDGTPRVVEEFLARHSADWMQLAAGQSNLGWGAGNNRAIRAKSVEPDYVLLCNPDAWIDEVSLRALVGAIERYSPRGAIAVPYLETRGEIALAANPEWTILRYILWDYIGGKYPYKVFQRKYQDRVGDFEVTSGYASGALALFSYPHLRDAGFFDERIFMYNDDIDITRTILKQGGLLLGTRDAVAFHADGLGSRIGDEQPQGTTPTSLGRDSEFVFIEKWHGRSAARALAWYRWVVFYRVSNLLRRITGREPEDTAILRGSAARYLRESSGRRNRRASSRR